MKLTLTFCLGFATAILAVSTLDSYTWRKTLLSIGCLADGRTGVWNQEEGHLCVDFSTAYSADEAFDRFIARLEAANNDQDGSIQ